MPRLARGRVGRDGRDDQMAVERANVEAGRSDTAGAIHLTEDVARDDPEVRLVAGAPAFRT